MPTPNHKMRFIFQINAFEGLFERVCSEVSVFISFLSTCRMFQNFFVQFVRQLCPKMVLNIICSRFPGRRAMGWKGDVRPLDPHCPEASWIRAALNPPGSALP